MPKEDDPDGSQPADGSVKDAKKAPPPKKGGKDAVVEEVELTPEEMEKQAKEIEARELQNSQLQSVWAGKSVEDKFFTYAEDKTREPCIKFPDSTAADNADEIIKTNIQEVSLTPDTLKDFEAQVNDPAIRGCNIKIEKCIPIAGELDSKGKAPAKGKGAPVGEESKPVNGEAWLDLTPFMYPGCSETIQRCFIKTIVEVKEETMEDGGEEVSKVQTSDKQATGDGGEDGQPEEVVKVFEERNSYVLIKVVLNEPLNPAIDPQVLPRSADIAKNAVQNLPLTFPHVIDAVQDYQNSIYAVVQEISIAYTSMFQGEEENSSALGQTGMQGTVKAHGNSLGGKNNEVREEKRERFLIEFNNSNSYYHLRQKLKRAIFRLAVEKYNKKVDHNGLQTKVMKEQFKADLYTFLSEQMKVFLNQAFERATNMPHPHPPMHSDLVLGHKRKNDEIELKIEKNFKETEYENFKRLSHECDLIQDNERAEWYIQNLLINSS